MLMLVFQSMCMHLTQVLLVGQCDVAATWCKEDDLPSSLLDEYNSKQQPHIELQSLNFSGQAAVTAVVSRQPDPSDEPDAKKVRIDRLNTATKGYIIIAYVLCAKQSCVIL